MRRVLALSITVLLALAVVFAVLLARRLARSDSAMPDAATRGPANVAPHESSGTDAEVAASSSLSALESEEQLRGAAPSGDRAFVCGFSRIRGRVVDETREAHAGALVWIFALDGEWKDGVTPPPLFVRGATVRAFSTTSDDGGAFEIVAPTPSGRRLRLEVETHDHRGHLFHSLEDRNAPERVIVTEGDVDLGELVVPVRGAILGRVTLDTGEPVRGASVGIDQREAGEFVAACATDAQGRYVLSCVPEGAYTVGAADPDVGFAKREDVRVGPRERVEGIDLVLPAKRTLSGIVVDDAGVPLRGFSVQGFIEPSPGRTRQHARTVSAADGTFRMLLEDDEPLFLRAGGGAFSEWTSLETSKPWFLPGATDIRIVLRRLSGTTLVVLDARTREPLTRVGVADVSSLEARRDPRQIPAPGLESRPGGRVPWFVQDPPQRVRVHARGHELREVELTGLPEQLVLLEPLAQIRGSLRRDGAPFAKARVWLRPRASGGAAERWHTSLRHEARGRPDWRELERPVIGRTDALAHAAPDGAFVLRDVDPGAWELLGVEDSSGVEVAHWLVAEIVVRAGQVLDVGALELPPCRASALLRILVDPPFEVRDVSVLTDVALNGSALEPFFERPIAPGLWRLADLAPGSIEAWTSQNSAHLGELARTSATIRAGEEVELVLDLRDRNLCKLVVHVDAGERTKLAEVGVLQGGSECPWIERWAPAQRRPVVFVARGEQRLALAAWWNAKERDYFPCEAPPDVRLDVELPARGLVETTIRLP